MTQLPLPIDDTGTASRSHSPALDAETIRRLKAVGITYICTRWNAWFGHWEHVIEIDRGRRGRSQMTKVDEGIAAMLREATQ